MDNRVTGPWIFTALPPPPPPPPLSFTSLLKHKAVDGCKTNFDDPSHKEEQLSLLKFVFAESGIKIISYYKAIQPVLQKGPTCGIVALSMASQSFKNIDAQVLLSTAKELNFTKLGEMFSVFDMANLASTSIDCDTVVVSDLQRNRNSILTHICNGWPVLIPYDKDKNNKPCLNNGHTAHWAVISGLCFALPEDYEHCSKIKFVEFSPGLKVHVTDDGLNVTEFLHCVSKVYLYAIQGKSKHLQLWDLDVLFESNCNLYEASNKFGADEIHLPGSGTLSELRDKAVLLKKK